MEAFKRKLKEFIYSFSTSDHYAEYDPNESSRYNITLNSSGASNSAAGTTTNGGGNLDEEMNIGLGINGPVSAAGFGDYNIDDFQSLGSKEGVSEVLLAWRHIESWAENHNPDLNATLGDPVTQNDIIHAEEDLEISFPPSVRTSMMIHDGQEDLQSMPGTSGLVYGLQLMTLDQIVTSTQWWRSVAKNLRGRNNNSSSSGSNSNIKQEAIHSTVTSSTSSPTPAGAFSHQFPQSQFKLPYIPEQKSIPPGAIQPVYAHPSWIPLVTDNAGNNIGIDLAPGATGKYGQVIIFGRDFDTKFVIADNWGEFLLLFANDLEAGNWYLVDDGGDYFTGDGELVFRDKKSGGPVQDYLDVLRKRSWDNFTRKLGSGEKQVKQPQPQPLQQQQQQQQQLQQRDEQKLARYTDNPPEPVHESSFHDEDVTKREDDDLEDLNSDPGLEQNVDTSKLREALASGDDTAAVASEPATATATATEATLSTDSQRVEDAVPSPSTDTTAPATTAPAAVVPTQKSGPGNSVDTEEKTTEDKPSKKLEEEFEAIAL